MNYTETLLAPISDDNVCGESLEDDAEFQNFFFTAQGVPERYDGETTIAAQAPDWRLVEKEALVFLSQTKDLKLFSVLAQSVLSAKGIVPFSECIKAIATLLREQWETVHPLLDEDEGDPLERLAGLSQLNHEFVISALKTTSLVNVKGVGNITLSVVEEAVAESNNATFSLTQIKGMFAEKNSDEVQLLHRALAYSLVSFQDINECLVEKSGHEYTVDFSKIERLLKELLNVLETCANVKTLAEQASIDDDSSSPEQSKVSSGPVKISGDIKSREDVERCLDMITQYYAKYEPSSPIPVLVHRAVKLVHKDFLAIVKDIYPEGLDSVHRLGGIDPKAENENERESSDGGW